MRKIFDKLRLPRKLNSTVDGSSLHFSFMERGAFEQQFSDKSFITKKQPSTQHQQEVDLEDDRARMM